MFRRLKAVILPPLNELWFGTRVSRCDAWVEPSSFPEEEYPVYCGKCGYLLRGLPGGKCPECGEVFERGRLLVCQYVFEWPAARWMHSTAGKWFSWLLTIGVAVPLLGVLGFLASACLIDWDSSTPFASTTMDWVFEATIVFIVAVLPIAIIFNLTALVIVFKTYPRGAWKRRCAVLRAIRRAEDVRSSSD